MSENQNKCVCSIGGQALIEGVMMQSKTTQALAVKNDEGFVEVKTRRLKPMKIIGKIPLVRGCVAFIRSLISGTKLIYESSEVAFPDEETPGTAGMTIATLLSLVLAIGLFFVLPSVVISAIEWIFSISVDKYLVALFEGIVRILIFIVYLLLVSKLNDVKRTFMYHGAEHRTINCYESGEELTVENVQKQSTRHNRCGTTFLFFVMITSILIIALATYLASLVGLGEFVMNKFTRILFRLILLPLIAGFSYELLQWLAKMKDNKFVSVLRAPGLALQRLTTYAPDDEMAKIAITAFTLVMRMDENPEMQESNFGSYPIAKMREFIVDRLKNTDADQAEADWILCEVLKTKRATLNGHKPLDKEQFKAVMKIVKEREKNIPLDYILGESEFYGVKIKVNENVLIPRIDTEIVVETALKQIKDGDEVLDLMTGSGCIARAISENSRAIVYASDINENAIETAKTNFSGTIYHSDVFENIDKKFDVIVSNPPYIPTSVVNTLEKEVLKQPIIALDGGENGLVLYEKIAKTLKKALKAGGTLVLEIGYDQGNSVPEIFSKYFESVQVVKDLSNNDRVVVCKNFLSE